MSCSNCNKFVSEEVYEYSMEHYGKVLCRDCQGNRSSSYRNNQKKSRKKPIPTPEQIRLWEILRKNGFDAQLEKWDGHKHIDIAIPACKVNIEVDGGQHFDRKQALADLKRTFHSFKKGYVTLRIPNPLVRENVYETASYIIKFLRESESQLDEEVEDEDEFYW